MGRVKLYFFSLVGVFLLCPLGIFASQPKPWEIQFQKAATPVMEMVTHVHNTLLIIIFAIALLVGILLVYVMWRYRKKKNPVPSQKTHNILLEVLWTLIPAIIVLVLLFPALRALYFMDQVPEATMTVKVTAHQWYWTYDYPDHKISFDSYMLKDKDLKPGDLRLLSVDNPLVIPVQTVVRIQMTSTDVIHSWAVPSFGVKRDTVPGRLTEVWVRVDKEGTYYGQCSELCGPGHGFMPIEVRVVSKENFDKWLQEAAQRYA